MSEKFACMQCGFVFDDPDMDMCPKCGTELGKEWNPDELVDVLVTDLAGAKVPDLIRVVAEISGYPTQKIGPMLQKLPAVVYSGATPMQADAYLDKIRATNAAAMAESCHDKSVRMTAEANAAGAAAAAATEQARLSAAERQAQLDAEMKLKTEQAEAEARANAELNAKLAAERAEAEKAIAEEKAKAEAEARAKAEAEAQKAETEKAIAEAEAQKAQAEAEAQKAEAEKAKAEADAKFAAEKAKAEAEALAQAEIEKKRLEIAAEEKAKQDVINAQKRKKRTILISIIAVVVVAAAALLISHICEQNQIKAYEKQLAAEKAEADRKAALEQQRIENERKIAEAKAAAAKAAAEKAKAEREARFAAAKAAAEKAKAEAVRIARIAAAEKKLMIKKKIEEIKKLPVPKFVKRPEFDQTGERNAKIVANILKFYRKKGAPLVFISKLRESDGLKHGVLATYSFPTKKIIFEEIKSIDFDMICKCTEIFASGENRTVEFVCDEINDYLIYEIKIDGIKFDLNKSLDDLL